MNPATAARKIDEKIETYREYESEGIEQMFAVGATEHDIFVAREKVLRSRGAISGLINLREEFLPSL